MDERNETKQAKADLLLDLASDSNSSASGSPNKSSESATTPTFKSPSAPKGVIPAVHELKKSVNKTTSETDLDIKEDHFPMEHVVDARDTLDKVAAKYNTTPTRLAQYNKLSSRFIFAGQVRHLQQYSFILSFQFVWAKY
jgi:LysM repeat protein